MSTVLFLTETLAVWVCFVRGMAVNVHVEPIQVESSQYRPCSWLQGKQAKILLMLDSDGFAIDAYPLQRVGSKLRDKSNVRALRTRLIEQFPDAIVTTPKQSSKLDTLLVQHPNLLQRHRQWLSWVEQGEITISSVVTSVETLADLFAFSKKPYIVVSNVLGIYKHTFCRAGYALFTRSFHQLDTDELQSALQETIAHLRSSWLMEEGLVVYMIGFSVQSANVLSKLDGVNAAHSFETMPEYTHNTVDVADESLSQYGSVIQIAKHAHNRFSAKCKMNNRHVSILSSKRTEQRQTRRYCLQLTGLLTVCVLSIVYSGLFARDQFYQQAQLRKSKADLSMAIGELHAELNELSPVALPLSQALLDAMSIQSVLGLGPGVLLSTLGELLTTHRSLVLDELTWVSVEHADAVSHTRNSNASLERQRTRQTLPVEGASHNSVLVNLLGRSLSGSSLRGRQEAVNALLADLQQQPGVSDIQLVESPLRSVAVQSPAGSETASLFRVQFQMKHKSIDDG